MKSQLTNNRITAGLRELDFDPLLPFPWRKLAVVPELNESILNQGAEVLAQQVLGEEVEVRE